MSPVYICVIVGIVWSGGTTTSTVYRSERGRRRHQLDAAELGNSDREKQELVRRCKVFLDGSPRPDGDPMKTLKETGETRWRLVAGLEAPVRLVELFRQIPGALLLCDGTGVEGVRSEWVGGWVGGWISAIRFSCTAADEFDFHVVANGRQSGGE
uniref:Uncharacterized protein n=1 Tax=Chromera velia CCMP2878 TaxID=1169474 RepID=A0A0G4HJM6_9ALVE|eukprot:Cvel_7113.t1-p1 / transcript=Cvel_7113.t1 / gene=Cvel_7113 / organism=Chromera_velia_CCMP2878 / gene_product=hypothetical protein / transcript_product=hypothetical protein / location=Cvel_scaffold364:70865-73924(+) / protein_length=154 / sequence_SO=supercontig / SO=protein_coding / is_pseudo=false